MARGPPDGTPTHHRSPCRPGDSSGDGGAYSLTGARDVARQAESLSALRTCCGVLRHTWAQYSWEPIGGRHKSRRWGGDRSLVGNFSFRFCLVWARRGFKKWRRNRGSHMHHEGITESAKQCARSVSMHIRDKNWARAPNLYNRDLGSHCAGRIPM